MSGHSKWSTIKRQKGASDIKRGQTFTKVANAITIAVKLGGSEQPDSNPRLRAALEEAKAVNMPKDNVQRAIDRGAGKVSGQALDEVIFEGFGPFKSAYLIEAVTDNKLRTLQLVKNLFERSGGSLGGAGSVIYMFDRIGEIRVKSKGGSAEDEMLQIIDLGAEDVEDYVDDPSGEQRYLVYVEGSQLNILSNKITQSGFEVCEAQLIYKPNTLVEIKDPEETKKVLDFAQKLEELEDVQKVYANFDIVNELMG